MIPPLILIAAGGLFGMAHERFRRKRLAAQISSELTQDESVADATDPEEPAMVRGDLVQVKHSQVAARTALGVSAVGMLAYPPMILVSLPLIGYSAYNWLSTRYAFEQPMKKSPLRIVAVLALLAALATGQWLLASIILTTDLAARKWLANWTKGSRWMEETDKNPLRPLHERLPQRLKT